MFYLSDLDYLTMTDAYEYVGLTVTNHGDLSGYGSLSHVNDSFASEIGSIYSEHHEQVNNVNLSSKGSILEAFESVTRKEDIDCELIGTKNSNLACDGLRGAVEVCNDGRQDEIEGVEGGFWWCF
ncbi:hypothetical protein E3N88_20129 [Mikania micrantha]|uniref:Uncharacterized protein n=1 Tax=Mikania micrantha TaxID=192012 RepID=A0A5N6NG48_9ASTR|nr:hypothetical protein E3N88_20129 [Mikania micrantha]